MLIEFTIGNFRSIKERQTFSLVKGTGKEHQETNCTPSELTGLPFDILKSAAVYGPNASGKTTLLNALTKMSSIVRSSYKDDIESISIDSFFGNDQPVFFDVTFLAGGIRYQYGFETTRSQITGEWLYAYPTAKAQTWFVRTFDPETKKTNFKFGNFLTGRKKTWEETTRPTSLFLSTAVSQNSQQLLPVYQWFTSAVKNIGFNGVDAQYTLKSWCTPEKKQQVLAFLNAADFSISDIIVDEFDVFDNLPQKAEKAIQAFFDALEDQEYKNPKVQRAQAQHILEDGSISYLDFAQESAGTQKMLALAGPILDVLANGRVLLFDEFNNSLHPKLAEFIISLFHDRRTNPKGAQIIFTTHDIWTLSQNIFRRDQIWFCDRLPDQSTSIYPLLDYTPRKGSNLAKDYMDGRYGAQPFVECLDFAHL